MNLNLQDWISMKPEKDYDSDQEYDSDEDDVLVKNLALLIDIVKKSKSIPLYYFI